MKRKLSASYYQKENKRQKLDLYSNTSSSPKKILYNQNEWSNQFHSAINKKQIFKTYDVKKDKHIKNNKLDKFVLLYFGYIRKIKNKTYIPRVIIDLIYKYYLSLLYVDIDFLLDFYIYKYNPSKYNNINNQNLTTKAKSYRKQLFTITKNLLNLKILTEANFLIQKSYHYYEPQVLEKVINIYQEKTEIKLSNNSSNKNSKKYIFNYLISPIMYYCHDVNLCKYNHPVGNINNINILNCSSLTLNNNFHFNYLKYAIKKLHDSLINPIISQNYRFCLNSEKTYVINFLINLNIILKLSKIDRKIRIQSFQNILKVKDILYITKNNIVILNDKNIISKPNINTLVSVFINKEFCDPIYKKNNKQAIKFLMNENDNNIIN